MDEKILTPDQVAQILQVHPFTVLKFIKQGKLRASKLGRVYRIRQSDVTKFLDEQEAASASKIPKKTTHKETDKQTAQSEDQMTLPTNEPPESTKIQKRSKEAENILEDEVAIIEPKPESFVQSVSKKQEQQETPNQARTDELDHYILD